MRKLITILFVSVIGFLTSCNSDSFEEHEIGDNLIDKSTEVFLLDTFLVESATVKLDSVLTSGYSNILFGAYQDEYFGDVSSEFYTTLGLGGSFEMGTDGNGNNTKKIQFDSLVFIGFTDAPDKSPYSRYYGDTLQEQSISFHQLTDEIDLPNEQIGFYAHHTVAHEEVPFGSASFYLKPIKQSKVITTIGTETIPEVERKRDGLRLRIDDKLGIDIVNMVNANDSILQNIFKWRKFFKGMVMKPGAMNTALFSFQLKDPGMKLRLYFRYEGGARSYHDFPVIVTTKRKDERYLDYYNFSNFTSAQSDTPQNLERIVEETEELESEETDDLAFIQGGVGFYTKVRIPHIETLNNLGRTGGLLKAELIFYPKEGSFDDTVFRLPTSGISVYVTNRDNDILSALTNSSGTAVSAVYNVVSEHKNERYYSIDLTSYVNNILTNGQDYEDAILIGFPYESVGNKMERMVIENDINNDDFRIRFKATYVVQN